MGIIDSKYDYDKRFHHYQICRHCGTHFKWFHPETQYCICSGLEIEGHVPEEVYDKYGHAWYHHAYKEEI